MSKLNAAWHERHPLLRNATMAQRVKWHLAHVKACGCRDIPKTVVAELRVRGIPIPQRRRTA
jgi:hypothetical protein